MEGDKDAEEIKERKRNDFPVVFDGSCSNNNIIGRNI
jgi:hypothetical protein